MLWYERYDNYRLTGSWRLPTMLGNRTFLTSAMVFESWMPKCKLSVISFKWLGHYLYQIYKKYVQNTCATPKTSSTFMPPDVVKGSGEREMDPFIWWQSITETSCVTLPWLIFLNSSFRKSAVRLTRFFLLRGQHKTTSVITVYLCSRFGEFSEFSTNFSYSRVFLLYILISVMSPQCNALAFSLFCTDIIPRFSSDGFLGGLQFSSRFLGHFYFGTMLFYIVFSNFDH